MKSMKLVLRYAFLAPVMLGLTGCLNIFGGGSSDSVAPSERQLPAHTQALLALKGMTNEAPIFLRIFKEESELEVWKLKNGKFELFKTYAICAWSGTIGPKVQQGDKQAPEGFYTIGAGQLNPHSLYHLAFNIGFPNAYDRANGHSGSALMIHGNCKSAGCYAMTDAYIEEIYVLARDSLNAGQTRFHVHAYPFRMTEDNMQKHRDSPWYPFWTRMKEGYDSFEKTSKPPVIKVCAKQYLVNVQFPGLTGDPAPEGACPLYAKIDPNQSPAFDGVPATMLASLKKPEKPQMSPAPEAPAEQPTVIAASMQPAAPAPKSPSRIAASPAMSASPVITRAAPARPVSLIANLQPAKPAAGSPAAPHVAAASAPAATQPAASPLKVAAATTGAQPVGYQPAAPAAETAPPVATEAPTKFVDPDALQKPNRSGKGGKLPAPSAPPSSSDGGSGSAPSQAQANDPGVQASYGFSGQMR